MGKTIKIIDLLNKIANGEELPKKILYRKVLYEIDLEPMCHTDVYRSVENEDYNPHLFTDVIVRFNDEVEIIEEDKEIEKLNTDWLKNVDMFDPKNVELAIEMLVNQLNKTIDVVNELKKGK